ncbi:response regulator transcription factor [Coprococcus comes]|nr:winged helix-turn-helix domain-containing protein [Coprococcus comes]NSD32553.1 response regulator transcription factor [Coprococcus comes]NSF09069.1 response regulator transcription factor [Coprococcus comes]
MRKKQERQLRIDNIVYCLVSSMRKKIEPELKQCRYIKTVRGVGYKFEGKKMDIFPE